MRVFPLDNPDQPVLRVVGETEEHAFPRVSPAAIPEPGRIAPGRADAIPTAPMGEPPTEPIRTTEAGQFNPITGAVAASSADEMAAPAVTALADPASIPSDEDSENRSPAAPQRSHKARIQELMESTEFQADLARVSDCLDQESLSGLEVGRIAARWIGDARYSHVLNSSRFAQLLRQRTGRDLDRKFVETRVKAYKEHEFHKSRGEAFQHLDISHLAQIARCRCRDDEERIELARRANAQHASVRQIRHLAQQLHQEAEQRLRVVDIEPARCDVRVMDGLDLIREQPDRTIDCLILDWQWCPVTWGGHAEFPAVHSLADPVDHLCSCLSAAGHKLADNGMAFLFYTSVGLLDRRIEDAWLAAGLKHAGQLIWQKACGAIMNADTPLATAHEHVHVLCRSNWAPRSACGYVSSVTPRWAAPTAVQSGRQKDAVHPHQKPVELVDRIISMATARGLVVDLFAGSGAAGIAAAQRGCEYRGAELVPEYAAIANERIACATDRVEEVYEAINFMMVSANEEQRQAIVRRLAASGMDCMVKARRQAA